MDILKNKKEPEPAEKPEDIVKKYKLKPGDFRLKIRILEVQDLIPPKGGLFQSNTCNPYVVAEILQGKIKKKTKHREKTLSAVFNETFILELQNLKKSELEEGVIKFSVHDRGRLSDTYIGSYELDLTSIYFSLHHQLNEIWMSLTDLTDEREGCLGYLKVSLEFLGPGDEPVPVPEVPKKDAENPGERLYTNSRVKQTGHTISLNFYRAECLAPLDLTTLDIDAFITVKYGGVIVKSSVITSQNPVWNENLRLGAMLPNNSKFVLVEVWDRDLMSSNDLVGCFRIPFKEIQNQETKPVWVNLYGPPLSAIEGEVSDYMAIHGYEVGSHFRGRLMYSASTWDELDPKSEIKPLKFEFPTNPEPSVPSRSYLLRVDIFEGRELPNRSQGIIHVAFGPYIIKTKPQSMENGRCIWYESIADKKVSLPDDEGQLPDIIIYFADDNVERRRHSYCRLKAKDYLDRPIDQQKPFLVKLREDRSLDLVQDDEFPGFVFVRIELLSKLPPPRQEISITRIKMKQYQLRVHLYIGRDLPPSDTTGTSDPFVLVRCAGKTACSRIVPETLNPNWYETLTLEVELPDLSQEPNEMAVSPPPSMSLVIYDSDDGYDKRDLLGRMFLIMQDGQFVNFTGSDGSSIPIYFKKPGWHNVRYDVTDQVTGRILVGYALIPLEQASLVPQEDIYPNYVVDKLHVFMIGVRGLMANDSSRPKEASCKIDVPKREHSKRKANIKTPKERVTQSGFNIIDMFTIEVELPKNVELCPLLDFYVYSYNVFGTQQLLGNGTLSVKSVVEFYGDDPSKLHSHFASELLQLEDAVKNAPMDIEVSAKVEVPDEVPVLMQPEREEDKKKAENGEDDKRSSPKGAPTPKGQPTPTPTPAGSRNAALKSAKKDIETTQKKQDAPAQGKAQKFVFQEEKPSESKVATLQFERGHDRIDLTETTKMLGQSKKESEPKEARVELPDIEVKMDKSEHDISAMDPPDEMGHLRPISGRKIATLRVGTHSHIEEASSISSNAVSMQDYMKANIRMGKERNFRKGDDDDKKKKESLMAKMRGLSLFKRFQAKKESFTYEDYDTDPDENLSVIPDYMKNRGSFPIPLEQTESLGKSSICAIPIKRGQTRGSVKKLFKSVQVTSTLEQVAMLKCVFVPERAAEAGKIERCKAFMTKSKQYVLALYVLRGLELITPSGEAKPDTYLKIFHGDHELDDQEQSLRKETNSPEYYRAFKLMVRLPGPATIRIEIWQDQTGTNEMVGYTEMDIENRYFSKQWLALRRKPVETRVVKAEGGERSVGRIEVFAELYKDLKQKIWDVAPLPILEYELRVIVWKTKDTVFKDEAEKCNDIFVRGGMATQEFLETDTHWRCRSEGSFNWRWKFKIKLPIKPEDYGGDRFMIQLWDRDISAPNELIGEADISLNIHRMLDKAYKRQKPVKMLRKWMESDATIAERLWFDVYHPEVLDDDGNKKSQGRVCLSFEIVPKDVADKKENANGRDTPNNYPVLPEPTGRLSFDIANPLGFLKDILGPDLYRKCWCFLLTGFCMTLLFYFGFYFITNGLAIKAFGR